MDRRNGAGPRANNPETPRHKNEAAIASLKALLNPDAIPLPSSRTISHALEQHGLRRPGVTRYSRQDRTLAVCKNENGSWYTLAMAEHSGYVVTDGATYYEALAALAVELLGLAHEGADVVVNVRAYKGEGVR